MLGFYFLIFAQGHLWGKGEHLSFREAGQAQSLQASPLVGEGGPRYAKARSTQLLSETESNFFPPTVWHRVV